MSTDAKTSNTKFMTINEFKLAMNLSTNDKAQVIKNPNTGKLFLSIGSQNFKCQQDINSGKEMKMLVNNDNLVDACLANVKSSTENILFEV